MRPRRLFASVLALLIATCSAGTMAAADEEADALAQRAAKGEPAAIVKLLELARAGEPEAQLRVGTLYYDGLVVQRNLPLALEWLRKATA